MSDYGADEALVAYISGVNADGTIASRSFHNWNGSGDGSQSGSYSYFSDTRKWGGGAAGTGATVSYAFDAGSNWTAKEQSAFVAAMHLWQAEANISFVPAASAYSANITITRSHDEQAQGYLDGSGVQVGGITLGTATSGGLSIDTSKVGFGPIGASFITYGGYPWMTVLHEIGHTIGLGHAGAYNGDANALQQNGSDDIRSETVMSYFDSNLNWGNYNGLLGQPVTPMALDIAAIQRLYGMPINSPLGGGDVFGFNSNIQGDVRQFFDFSVNTRPIVTLWSGGTGNTLDLTGYSSDSVGSLAAGSTGIAAISAGGLSHNIAIADDTRIDTVLLGAGNDTFSANDDSDYLIGGAGADRLGGGAGNDHIYGGGPVQTPNDGADTLNGGGGGDYLQGNAGDDTLDGGAGDDRVYGGADNDRILGGDGNDTINGNLGNDTIDGGDGNDLMRGGQGDDVISGGFGDDVVLGDLGSDRIAGGAGADLLYGGDGGDTFVFASRDSEYAVQGADAYRLDEIADYASGTDHIHLDMGRPSQIIDLGAEPDVQTAASAAAPYVNGSANAAANFSEVVKASVGNDTVFFWWSAAIGEEGVRIDGLHAGSLTGSDFV